ncbi:Cytochrome b6-f complex subunit petO, chloroplastic [Tetrabaena socialis]|uniref:Cytochrome b6-f complex subunit petO, chloroplastic n=1 Tax=Tetrabaena socialis TaxID=47790 RepID=A0A2J8AK67_9CHLO|nr:Cytochrome b6-f complex subunit petO, chloroplastic [Tetrabaena socialis]|eukprot:PNH12900.1 Cytochrome b6-f complex subunit petO, chloroplastic [Tetrabaena socialis]
MALSTRCKAPVAVSARSRRSVRVSAHKGGLQQVQLAAAAVAAATLLAGPADAGVVYQQPERKKLFQDDAPAAVVTKREFKGLTAPSLPGASSDAPKAAAAPKKEVVSEQGTDLDPRLFALPGALVLTIGGFVAASKIDTSFDAWFMEAFVRDSNNYVGYEVSLKTDAGVTFPKSATGTKKVKANSSAGTKKGGFNFFGKK